MAVPGEQHDMVIDSVHFGSKSVQAKVVLLFDKKANPQLNQFLIDNAGNPVASWFSAIQGSLELVKQAASKAPLADAAAAGPDEPDAVMDTMIVDGEPAKVKRPRKSSNGNGNHAEPSLHRFRDNEETPGLCGLCHHRVEDEAHNVSQPHAFRQPHGLVLNSDTYEEDAKHCDVCGLEMYDTSNVHGAGIAGAVVEEVESTGNDLADSLIEDAREAVGAGEGA